EPLITALKDEDKDIRYMAARALEEIGSFAVEPLIAELSNSQSQVRVCATETLGKIGHPKAIEPLIATLKDENEDETVREYAVYALERIGKPAAEALIKALRDLKDPHAIAPLTAALFYQEQEVRDVAVEIVTNMSSFYSSYGEFKSMLERDYKKVPQSKGITLEYLRKKYWRKKGDSYIRFTQTTLNDFFDE
ncbi:MAG: HEAT repeat domain-containing protein, partial [Candidatus Heimdallarchaeota archaeon]